MAASRYFLDANIFLRLIDRADRVKTSNCEELFRLFQKKKFDILTSQLVLGEVVWTAMKLYQLKRSDTLRFLQSIAEIPGLDIVDRCDLSIAVSFYERFSVSLTDAFIAASLLSFSSPTLLVSYDRDFDKMNVPRIEPGALVKRISK